MTKSAARSKVRGMESARKKRQCKLAQSLPMNTNVQKDPVNLPVIASGPTLRISPAAQVQIVKLYLEGRSFVEISRQMHRDRRTVAKVCRSGDVQAMIQEQREKLIAEADAWRDRLRLWSKQSWTAKWRFVWRKLLELFQSFQGQKRRRNAQSSTAGSLWTPTS
jgi:hypothetical protein